MKWVPKRSQAMVCHSVHTCCIQWVSQRIHFLSLLQGQGRKYFLLSGSSFLLFIPLILHCDKTGTLSGKWEILVKVHSLNQSKAERWKCDSLCLSWVPGWRAESYFKTEIFLCFRLQSFIEVSKLKYAQISLATKRGSYVYLIQVLYYNNRVY